MPEVGAEARTLLRRVQHLDALASEVLGAEQSVRQLALQRLQLVTAGLVDAELRTIPITRLKGTTQGRLRIGPLEGAGYRSIADLLAAPDMALQMIPGVGPQTVAQTKAAARRIASAVGGNVRLTLDPDRKDPRQTDLLAAIRCLQDAEQMTRALAAPVAEFRTTTGPLGVLAQRATSKLTMFLSSSRRKQEAFAALHDLDRWMASDQVRWLEAATGSAVSRLRRPPPDAAALWADYGKRSAEYWTTLGQLGALGVDVDAAQGHVPNDIAQRVKRQALDDRFLEVGLRGYQDFGARFALAQRRVVLGDEMGLGKTIEALAAIAHLRATGERHFLVVCPASVVVNWLQEIDRRTSSELRAHRLHGAHRDWYHRQWLEHGGIAVTTYGTLSALPPPDPSRPPAMLVVDEAHYVKNPQAQRSRQVRRWTDACARVLFMSGTPTPSERQRLVDQFSRVDGHAVLVSQIEAGGVGLNIQAGSVVVLAEPQWKPSTEEQAIARCHRMGQIRRVHVHRLLAEGTVDRRMLDIVRYKAALFDAYARQSEVKDANPDAVDVSDVETAQRLATMPEAQAEAEIIRLERERLGLPVDDASAARPF